MPALPGGRIAAPATSGPAQAPRPASSTPAMRLDPGPAQGALVAVEAGVAAYGGSAGQVAQFRREVSRGCPRTWRAGDHWKRSPARAARRPCRPPGRPGRTRRPARSRSPRPAHVHRGVGRVGAVVAHDEDRGPRAPGRRSSRSVDHRTVALGLAVRDVVVLVEGMPLTEMRPLASQQLITSPSTPMTRFTRWPPVG